MRPHGVATTLMFLASGFFGLLRPAHGQWVSEGTPIAATSQLEFNQKIASDGSGGAFIIWTEFSTPKAQHVEANGFPLWPGGMPIVGSENICADGAGGMYVTSMLLQTQRYAADGSVAKGWPGGGMVAADMGGAPFGGIDYGSVKLALASDGSLLLAWTAYVRPTPQTAQFRLAAQKLSPTGAQQWGPGGVEVVPFSTQQSEIRGIASDGAGGAVLTWQDGNPFVLAQRIGSSGTTLWRAGGRPLSFATSYNRDEAIASDGASGAIVAWQGGPISGSSDIYVQRVAADSTLLWGPNGVAVCTAGGNQLQPAVLDDGVGGAIVAWADLRTGSAEVHAQRVLADGTIAPGWPADGVRVGAGRSCAKHVTLVPDLSGGALVGWGTTCSYGDDGDIRAQRLTASGAIAAGWLADGVVACAAPNSQNDPFTASDGAGGVILTWQDYRSGTSDIYAQRVFSGGGVLAVPKLAAPVQVALAVQPNPARGATRISVTLTTAARVRLEIVDLDGRRVRAFDSGGAWGPGAHAFDWNGCDARGAPVPSGVYFARLSGTRTMRRITLLR